jgi:AcrR family transcriptional regulator
MPRRAYQSPLRAEQVEQTRDRILDTFLEMLAEPGTHDVTIPELARRAGVSVRTAFRYFPTREALFDGLNDWWKRTSVRRLPDTPESFAPYVRALFEGFAEHESMIRATRQSKPLQEARARRKPQQRRQMAEVFAPITRHLGERDARKVAAVIHVLAGSDAWLTMRETWDLTSAEAADAAVWAMDVLIAQLKARKPFRPPS